MFDVTWESSGKWYSRKKRKTTKGERKELEMSTGIGEQAKQAKWANKEMAKVWKKEWTKKRREKKERMPKLLCTYLWPYRFGSHCTFETMQCLWVYLSFTLYLYVNEIKKQRMRETETETHTHTNTNTIWLGDCENETTIDRNLSFWIRFMRIWFDGWFLCELLWWKHISSI